MMLSNLTINHLQYVLPRLPSIAHLALQHQDDA